MAAANLLPVSSAKRYQAIPVSFEDPQTLLVAMADPADVLAADDIQMATGLTCRIAVATADDIEQLVGTVNSLQSAVTEAVEDGLRDEEMEEVAGVEDLHASAQDAPVVKLVYSILGQAVGRGLRTSTSRPRRTTCACASASTACSTRPRMCPSAWWVRSCRASRS